MDKKILDSINAPKDSAYRQMEKLLSPDFNFSSLDYDLQQLYSSRENMENRTWTALYLTHQQDIIKYAKENGFDGILDLEQSNQGGWSYNGFIAFKPDQIKSTDNRGTYDSRTPNIYYQTSVFDLRVGDEIPGYGKVEQITDNKIKVGGTEYSKLRFDTMLQSVDFKMLFKIF